MEHVRQAQVDDPDTQRDLAACGEGVQPHQRSLDGVLQNRAPGDMDSWQIHVPPATSCQQCQQRKARRADGVEQQRPRQPEEPFHTVALDVMGPYPRTTRGKRFLVVTTDVFTRWSEAFAVSNARAGTIVAILDSEVFPRYGYPKTLLTDNGTQFTGRRWAADCRRWGVEHHTTPTYHPRANPTERRNQDIKVQLRLRLGDDHSKWDVHLPKLLYCLRRRVNAVTGHSPAELLHGQNLALQVELRVAEAAGAVTRPPAIDLREEAGQHQAQFLATRTPQSATLPTPLEPGQMVYARCHHLLSGRKNYCAGLSLKWAAPREVLRRLGPTTYLIRLPNGRATKIHRDDLRLVSTAEDPSKVFSKSD
ncbi:uncharacterized protein K02A2.6-like [Bacillus rossius redtenbacheri]|uniref:uncharacterized protein K02A2.6-like n=1 Tax=Bacillus rossius redtenbacheri TaxID=93214 RepID=UPI002FDD9190